MGRRGAAAVDVARLAREIDTAIRAMPEPTAAHFTPIWRRYSRAIQGAAPRQALGLAHELIDLGFSQTHMAYALLASHRPTLDSLTERKLKRLGRALGDWSTVDSFSLGLAGPAWREGQISDATISRWARSKDRWWRRAAAVCTVALNRKARGGTGDVPRTLEICRQLAADRDDMVVKAVSWALRELVAHDRKAVRRFLAAHDAELAGRIKREVTSKLTTGRKNARTAARASASGRARRSRPTGTRAAHR
jgi:3-methyladenine DNA glycosylase AlkD